MNLNSKPVHLLAGAVIGIQAEKTVSGVIVPSQFAAQKDLLVAGGVLFFLMWSGRPGGMVGNVLEGAAIGVGAVAISRRVRVPGV